MDITPVLAATATPPITSRVSYTDPRGIRVIDPNGIAYFFSFCTPIWVVETSIVELADAYKSRS